MTVSLRRRFLFILLAVGFAFGGALGIGEITLRLIRPFPSRGSYLIWPPNLTRVFLPQSSLMPEISGPSSFRTNSLGLRGDEPSEQDRLRILCIGGSTTECLYLDQAETWPHLLQQSLNNSLGFGRVWVGNAGKSGLTTRHHLVALKYLPLRALDIKVVVFLVGVNDLSVFIANSGRAESNSVSVCADKENLIQETFAAGYQSSGLFPIFRRTALWIEGRNLKRWLMSKRRQDPAGRIYKQWRYERATAREFLKELPEMKSALEEYARNIERLISSCRSLGIRPLFMTQPSMWRADLPDNLCALLWFGGVAESSDSNGRSVYYSVEAMQRVMEAYNSTLLRVCSLQGAECIDLAPQIPKDTSAFYDDVHFNEGGARAVALVLSGYLLKNTTQGSESPKSEYGIRKEGK